MSASLSLPSLRGSKKGGASRTKVHPKNIVTVDVSNTLSTAKAIVRKASITRNSAKTQKLTSNFRGAVERAVKEGKVFKVDRNSAYNQIRRSLLSRGWLDKDRILLASPDSPAASFSLPQSVYSPKNDFFNATNQAWISRVVDRHQPNFLWSLGRHSIPFTELHPDQIVNQFPQSIITTKVGIIACLQNSHWVSEAGIANTYFPRCYRLALAEEKAAFISDFQLTSCLAFLQWIVGAYEADTESGVTSPEGKLQPFWVEFATAQILNYAKVRNHEDLDWATPPLILVTGDWDTFYQVHHMLVFQNEKFAGENPLTLYSKSKLALQSVAPFWPQLKIDGTNNLWICKPGALARGSGIMVTNKFHKILNLIAPTNSKRTKNWVVQKYIERPLLIYKTKFDIRQWFLVSEWNNMTVWFYRESYIRFSSQHFSLEDLHESIHLCNNSIQKKFTNASVRDPALPADNMWDNYTFQAYLQTIGHPQAWDEIVIPGMKTALLGVLLAGQDKFEFRKNCFELFGADFMLTEDFVPWLIEINASPSMEASTSVTSRMRNQVLEDCIKVIIDRKEDPKAKTGMFELIYRQNKLFRQPPFSVKSLGVEGSKSGHRNDSFMVVTKSHHSDLVTSSSPQVLPAKRRASQSSSAGNKGKSKKTIDVFERFSFVHDSNSVGKVEQNKLVIPREVSLDHMTPTKPRSAMQVRSEAGGLTPNKPGISENLEKDKIRVSNPEVYQRRIQRKKSGSKTVTNTGRNPGIRGPSKDPGNPSVTASPRGGDLKGRSPKFIKSKAGFISKGSLKKRAYLKRSRIKIPDFSNAINKSFLDAIQTTQVSYLPKAVVQQMLAAQRIGNNNTPPSEAKFSKSSGKKELSDSGKKEFPERTREELAAGKRGDLSGGKKSAQLSRKKYSGKFIELSSGNSEQLSGKKEETLTGNHQVALAEKNEEVLAAKNLEALNEKNQEAVAGKKQEALAAKNQTALAGQNQTALAGQNQTALAGPNQEALAGQNQEASPGKNLKASPGKNQEPSPGKNYDLPFGKSNSLTPGKDQESVAGKLTELQPGKSVNPSKKIESSPPKISGPTKNMEQSPGKKADFPPGKKVEDIPGKNLAAPGKIKETPGKRLDQPRKKSEQSPLKKEQSPVKKELPPKPKGSSKGGKLAAKKLEHTDKEMSAQTLLTISSSKDNKFLTSLLPKPANQKKGRPPAPLPAESQAFLQSAPSCPIPESKSPRERISPNNRLPLFSYTDPDGGVVGIAPLKDDQGGVHFMKFSPREEIQSESSQKFLGNPSLSTTELLHSLEEDGGESGEGRQRERMQDFEEWMEPEVQQEMIEDEEKETWRKQEGKEDTRHQKIKQEGKEDQRKSEEINSDEEEPPALPPRKPPRRPLAKKKNPLHPVSRVSKKNSLDKKFKGAIPGSFGNLNAIKKKKLPPTPEGADMEQNSTNPDDLPTHEMAENARAFGRQPGTNEGLQEAGSPISSDEEDEEEGGGIQKFLKDASNSPSEGGLSIEHGATITGNRFLSHIRWTTGNSTITNPLLDSAMKQAALSLRRSRKVLAELGGKSTTGGKAEE